MGFPSRCKGWHERPSGLPQMGVSNAEALLSVNAHLRLENVH